MTKRRRKRKKNGVTLPADVLARWLWNYMADRGHPPWRIIEPDPYTFRVRWRSVGTYPDGGTKGAGPYGLRTLDVSIRAVQKQMQGSEETEHER